MHSTAELKKEMAELRAELEALKKATAKPAHIVAAEEAAEAAIVAEHERAVAAIENSRKHDLWFAERNAKLETEEAAIVASMAMDGEGNPLPDSEYRDACGIIRERKSGLPVAQAQRQRADIEQVGCIQAQEHRSYLQRIGMRPHDTSTPSTQGDTQ